MEEEIFNIIEKEFQRQTYGIELIASENYVSQNVMKAVGSILTNKYAEGYPDHRYYGGCEFVDEIENLAIARAKKLFGVNYVNVQPHSGTQTNASVLTGFLNPGDKILGMNIACGGHLTHGTPVSFSGKLFQAFTYGVSKETELIDFEEVAKIAHEIKPKIIICGASAYSRDIDYKTFRKIADEVGALLMADIAHPAGLIACGILNDPFDFCHVVTTTTHKTLRGPRGGMIMMRNDFENPFAITDKKGNLKMASSLIDASVFPGNQGGPFMHVIAGKAVAFAEDLSENYKKYINQVWKNAKHLAKLFEENGYRVVSGGTENHLMVIDLHNKNVTGKEVEIALDKVGIAVNKNMIPFDDRSAFTTSGIRIGTPAITTRGFKEDDCTKVFDFIDEAIKHYQDDEYLRKMRNNLAAIFSLDNKPIFE
ncbi:MAG: serine hydroxymethyltransferase [Cytophagales bacterium]|jgi:glycine hydroxymethyltransferase|nr:serine hydroxymethyltransferase [Cytophagales bacterium]